MAKRRTRTSRVSEFRSRYCLGLQCFTMVSGLVRLALPADSSLNQTLSCLRTLAFTVSSV